MQKFSSVRQFLPWIRRILSQWNAALAVQNIFWPNKLPKCWWRHTLCSGNIMHPHLILTGVIKKSRHKRARKDQNYDNDGNTHNQITLTSLWVNNKRIYSDDLHQAYQLRF